MELVGFEGLPDVLEGVNSSDEENWQPVWSNFGSIDPNFSAIFRKEPISGTLVFPSLQPAFHLWENPRGRRVVNDGVGDRHESVHEVRITLSPR